MEENKAKKGAGVFATAYYYASANAICADTPAAGASEKPGLYVKNAQITDNTADTADGMGGGTWYFKGFDKDSVAAAMENADESGNVKFTGSWEFTAADNRVPSDNGGTPSGNDKSPSAKTDSTSPQTGDTGNIGFWLTLLLLGGGALIATTAVRTTKKNNK